MILSDLLAILADPDLPHDLPVRVLTGHRVSTWEWELEGASALLNGPERHLILELRSVASE